MLSSPLRPRVRARIAHIYGRLIVSHREVPGTDPVLLRTLREAAEIEPALSWVANGFAHIDEWVPPSNEFATVFEGLASALAGTEVLILAPWVGIGGADLVTLNYARALANAPGLDQKVSVLTTYLPERTIRSLIPERVRHFQMDTIFRDWPLERQQKLIAQLMVFLQPKLILSINCFDFTNSLRSTRARSAQVRTFISRYSRSTASERVPIPLIRSPTIHSARSSQRSRASSRTTR